MALTSTLYRFRLELSDVDRGNYKSLDMRVAMHPSEAAPYLVTRVLAFAANECADLAFNPEGLSNPDLPCLSVADPQVGYSLWIEIGNPSVRKLHRAAKAARAVKVYTFKNPLPLIKELQANSIYNQELLEIYALAPQFIEEIANKLERDNRWNIILSEGSAMVTVGDEVYSAELERLSLSRESGV